MKMRTKPKAHPRQLFLSPDGYESSFDEQYIASFYDTPPETFLSLLHFLTVLLLEKSLYYVAPKRSRLRNKTLLLEFHSQAPHLEIPEHRKRGWLP